VGGSSQAATQVELFPKACAYLDRVGSGSPQDHEW
jgi:hypothetical protein